MIDKTSFCSAPWTSMFYNKNGARICCTNSEFVPGSPDDFRNSSFLKEIKQEFLDGKRPTSCQNCWDFEDQGHESIRTLVYQKVTPLIPEYLKIDSNIDLQYLEFRASNLCNFSCRMCGPVDSSQIAKEVTAKPTLQFWFQTQELENYTVGDITDADFENIKNQVQNLKWLILTGGEPMLIKRYYDLLDYMIDNNYHKNVTLQFHTNASTCNPIILEKLEKFYKTVITFSLDAVGKVAEYQRHGTNWETVENNVFKLLQLSNVKPSVNIALSAYTILDMENLAHFLVKMYNANNSTWFNCRAVQYPKVMSPMVLNQELRTRAFEQLTRAIEILDPSIPNFQNVIEECRLWMDKLKEPINMHEFLYFARFTRDFDQSRNENFNQLFNYLLY